MSSKPVTIRDIARKLSVTPGTVSRALNNTPGVGEKTRLDILKLAKRMNYKPQPYRSKRSNTVGLLIGAQKQGVIDNEFLGNVVNAMASCASARGLYIHIDYVLRKNENAELPQMIKDNRVDGVVLAGFPPESLCVQLKDNSVPAVVLHDSAARTHLPTVQHNNFNAMKELVNGLIKLGHKDIALILTSRRYTTIEHRYQGYYTALEENGITYKPELVLEGLADNMSGGQEGVSRIYRKGLNPTAIICANDMMAVGAMMELCRKGLNIPEQVSVAGGGNFRLCEECSPSLTTLATPWNTTIDLSLDILEQIIEGKNSDHVTESIVDADVIWRESCGKAPC